MNLQQFLKQATDARFWKKNKSFCFQSDHYPYFFFYHLFKQLSDNKIISSPVNNIGSHKLDQKTLQTALQQTMLGETNFYWLSNITQPTAGKKKDILYSLLHDYNGPNTIAFFIEDQNNLPQNTIALPSSMTINDFKALLAFFNKQLPQQKLALAEQILQKTTNKVSLNTACLLMNYLELMHVSIVKDLPTYLSGSIDVQPALTTLADHFFKRNAQQFFSIWYKVADQYSEMFWLSFWSDQIWRAYYTRLFLEQKSFAQAKRMSYRLPYHFINNDWKKVTLQELSALHDDLYTIDYKIKQGSQFCHLDRWYLHYFENKKAG